MAGKVARSDVAGGVVPLYRPGTVGVDFYEGQLVGEDVDGLAVVATTNNKVLGLVIAPGPGILQANTFFVGTGKANELQIVDARKNSFRFPRPGSIAVEDCQPGEYLDMATGGMALAADSNHDFYVEAYDAINDQVIVRCAKTS